MTEVEELKVLVSRLNGSDDTFFQEIGEDVLAAEEILQTILDDTKLNLEWSYPQRKLRNMLARAVIPDLLCKDIHGRYFITEMQNSDNDDHEKRVRYLGSSVDTNFAKPGSSFKELPEIYAIYITNFDLFKEGKLIYHVHRTLDATGRLLSNGFHEIYVNMTVNDGSKTAKLMQYLLHTNGCHPLFPKLSARVQFLKNTKEGGDDMCQLVDEYAERRAEKRVKANNLSLAEALAAQGIPFETAVKIFTTLTEAELKQIYAIA